MTKEQLEQFIKKYKEDVVATHPIFDQIEFLKIIGKEMYEKKYHNITRQIIRENEVIHTIIDLFSTCSRSSECNYTDLYEYIGLIPHFGKPIEDEKQLNLILINRIIVLSRFTDKLISFYGLNISHELLLHPQTSLTDFIVCWLWENTIKEAVNIYHSFLYSKENIIANFDKICDIFVSFATEITKREMEILLPTIVSHKKSKGGTLHFKFDEVTETTFQHLDLINTFEYNISNILRDLVTHNSHRHVKNSKYETLDYSKTFIFNCVYYLFIKKYALLQIGNNYMMFRLFQSLCAKINKITDIPPQIQKQINQIFETISLPNENGDITP